MYPGYTLDILKTIALVYPREKPTPDSKIINDRIKSPISFNGDIYFGRHPQFETPRV